jgi:polysaccharide pyruvyl transferase WcaK-like protein
MKILHIASFMGNIGDNASHLGFYKLLKKNISNYQINKIEIRKFYKNYDKPDRMFFDKEFISHINSFDLCVIGGGGFLDYWVPKSQTGTTIDIDPALLQFISTPTLITSIGSNPHKKVPEGNIKKFRIFLDKVSENKNIKIAVRNDGSIESIRRDIGEKYIDKITEILDHGFFYDVESSFFPIVKQDYVAINITNDQVKMLSSIRGEIDIENYHKELALVVDYIVDKLNLHIVFVPHIYSDLRAISDLLENIDDSIIRNHITIAPCIQGDEGVNYLFSIYKKSEFVIGTRFHSNVCSLAMKKFTIGLIVLDRVKYLYDYFGLSKQAVTLEGGFSKNIIDILIKSKPVSNKSIDDARIKTLQFYKDNITLNY